MGWAHLFAGHYDEAASVSEKAALEKPDVGPDGARRDNRHMPCREGPWKRRRRWPALLAITPDLRLSNTRMSSAWRRRRRSRAVHGRPAQSGAARMTEQRRLAAILVADVVGYSKLMGSDEAGNDRSAQGTADGDHRAPDRQARWTAVQVDGDGFLIEFASAVQAVSCANAIQEANNQGRLPLRIGIHVGDVVVQGDDLMGDGVNVAARVEGIAEPGGIAITRAVHEQVRDKLDLGFMDKGEVGLKNIQRPVQVFVIGGTKVDNQATALPLPDKPSIAVLPFQNMSGDPEQEYFADGVTEDIITELSRFHGAVRDRA